MRHKRWTDDELKSFCIDCNNGYSVEDLMLKYNRSKLAVVAKLSIYKEGQTVKLKGKLVDFIELEALYKSGKSYKELAQIYRCDPSYMGILLKKAKILLRTASETQRTYRLDENYFDEIDCEEKAYFLGFLYADGYHYEKTATITLTLVESDREILEKLNALIYKNNIRPLNFVDRSLDYVRYGKRSKNQLRLTISNQHISRQLKAFGMMQAKSLIIKFPEWLREDLQRHFIRGYFDGDGSIHIRKADNIPCVSFCSGSIEFLKHLQTVFKQHLGLSKTTIFKHKQNKAFAFTYSGRKSTSLIKDYFYKDAKIFLARKYKKFFSDWELKVKTLCGRERHSWIPDNWFTRINDKGIEIHQCKRCVYEDRKLKKEKILSITS